MQDESILLADTDIPELCLEMLEAVQQKHRYNNYETKLEDYSDWMAFQVKNGNHKMMSDVAEGMNPSKLDEIDKNTKVIGIYASPTENKLIYQYVIANHEAFDENRQRQYQQNSFCTDPGFQPFRRDNVVMEFRYKSVDGNFISSIEVGSSGCE